MTDEPVPEPDLPVSSREPVMLVILLIALGPLGSFVQACLAGAGWRAAGSAAVAAVVIAAGDWARNRVTPLGHAQLAPGVPLVVDPTLEKEVEENGS